MANSSSKTRLISFRLSNATYAEIERVLAKQSGAAWSVGDYCRKVAERHVWRHSTRKYRREI